MQQYGIRDVPVKSIQDESLGLHPYSIQHLLDGEVQRFVANREFRPLRAVKFS
jgi:hypothetical protein